jgi:hypothetical protein
MLITPYTIIKFATSLTSERRKEIDSYLEWRKRLYEPIKPESPLFRRESSNTTATTPNKIRYSPSCQ